MADDDNLYYEQQRMEHLEATSSMVVIRGSPIFVKDDRLVFPPINHENLQVASSMEGVDKYLESPSESSSPSSSSRRSDSSSSFSLFPSDSDGQTPLTACGFDRKFPSETEGKCSPSLDDESPPSYSDGKPLLTTCQFDRKSPQSPSEQGGKSPPCQSFGKSLCKPLYYEAEVLQDWWELLLVGVYSKLKNLVTWFSTTLRSVYPVLAIAIWWWMRVRTRRKRVNGETTDRLRDAIKQRDERIVQLLHQIADMNKLLVKHHKDIVSRR